MAATLPNPWPDRFRRLSLGCAVVAAVVVLASLLGWLLGIEVLKRFVTGLPAIKFNSVLALLSACLAYGFQQRGRWAWGRLFASITLLLGAAALIEYATGIGLGIDQLLWPEPPGEVGTPFPGRIPPITAFVLVLLGSALLAAPSPRGVSASQLLSGLAGVTAFTSLVGYLYSVESLYGVAPEYNNISVPTIVAIMALAAAVALRATQSGPFGILSSPGPGGELVRSLLVPVWLLPVLIGAAVLWSINRNAVDPGLGVAIAMLLTGLMVLALLWLAATRIERLDEERVEALQRGIEQQRLQNMLNAMPNGILFIESQTGRLTANPMALNLLGCGRVSDMRELRRLEVICRPDGSALPVAEFPSSRALEGKTVVAEELMICGEGRRTPVLVNAAPVYDQANALEGAVVTYQDISARKELERQREMLLEREHGARRLAEIESARLQAVIDQMPEGFIMAGADGKILQYNQAALRFARGSFGEPDPFGNRSMFEVLRMDGSRMPWHEIPLVRALERKETVRSVKLLQRDREGRVVPMLANAAPVLDQAGNLIGAIALFQDISPLVELERLRDEYVSLISHDLKNPLAVVLAQADWLSELLTLQGQGDILKGVEAIRRNSRRMRAMLDDLLESNRLESGQFALHREPLDLAAWLPSVVETCVSPPDRARVHILPVPPLPPVQADRGRLERALVNVLDNALKYSAGMVTLRVSRDPCSVTLAVEDQGAGIDPEELPNLFNKYVRGRLRPGDGSGLGLYIAKLIVEAHSGRIWAESTPGKGSVFGLCLPLRPDKG